MTILYEDRKYTFLTILEKYMNTNKQYKNEGNIVMKTAKRILSVLVVFAMLMTMSIAVFAAGNDGKITITNPQSGATYKAYKVFDVTYDENGNYAYTASKAIKTLLDGNVEGLKFVENVNDTFTVTQEGTFSPATLAKYIKDNLNTFEAAFDFSKDFSADGNTMVADELERGYYFVSSSQGTVCELVTAKSVEIKDKNEAPAIEKTIVDADNTVEVGEVLTFNITGKVPVTTGYTTYTYKVSDTMSEGLTFNKDVKVLINGSDETANLASSTIIEDDGFSSTIDMTKYQNDVDKVVKIEYTATVNEKAIDRDAEHNNATLTYSNDPADGTSTGTSDKTVNIYSYNINIDKYDSTDGTVKLAGAKFVLKNSNNKYYKYDATAKKVSWVDTKSAATEVTTDENGSASFNGIAAGTYYLEETAAPEGYNPLSKDTNIEITISENEEHAATIDGKSTQLSQTLSATAQIANSTGTVLPETGNKGTMIFIIIGGIAVLAAGIILITNKRMKKESF